MTKTIDRDQLQRLLSKIKGEKTLVIGTHTTVKLVGVERPYEEVRKVAVLKVKVNYDYAHEINVRRLAEGKKANYQVKPAAWGEHLGDGPLLTHKEQVYLDCMVKERAGHAYFKGKKRLNKTLVESFIRDNPNHQGLEDQVLIRRYKLDSITTVILDNIEYTVADG